ncbi:glycosyltransferase family 4 protein [Paraburkholderia sp. SG-MS1]|uniref:glycosyltransferase family 4 protein n=1 Tax=Paraburkholderia sp. SG-MS1 TaxID=2023741 RepID=UPI001EEB2FA9|nr:glycosyltransferase family 1 protein [Paraburkholderia sp. SG-MS1]
MIQPIKTLWAGALQFAAIWWLPPLIKSARRTVMRVRPAAARCPRPTRQLLVDVSIIASHDAGTGIQRVVRSLLLQLLEAPPPGFEIRPVRGTRNIPYRYADRYLASLTSSAPTEEDESVQVFNGDIFLGLDLTSRIVPRRQCDLFKWRAKGVRCAFVVYDLLPLLHQHWFTPRAARSFRHWLSTLAIHADALLCISSSVSEQMQHCLTQRFRLTDERPATGWFHLGADLPIASAGTVTNTLLRTNPHSDASASPQLVLMVGTIEPRKGHAQVLDAFEILWQNGAEDTLIIAGRQGWQVESLVERLTRHPEAGKRLRWFSDTSDSQLAQLYSELNGLVMASEAEGFGLPLVEAAQYGMPLFARDLAVFREVASEHATYFTANNGEDLAPQLAHWLEQLRSGTAPFSHAMKSLTWSASAEQLKVLIADLDRAN